MSWDVMLFSEKFNLELTDYELKPMGKNEKVGAMLTSFLPNFKYHSDGWSVLNHDDFSI